MSFDLSKPYNFYFNEISKIPHGSYNEKQISQYIVDFAIAHNLEYIQDELYNVVVYKPGSAGYEHSPALIIQAHIDMVNEKTPESQHDFFRDPLKLIEENDILTADGTTLGADDGQGVAYMLAILADDSLAHPPLECAFTTMEEIGLNGAMALKPEYFNAKQYICLDGGGERVTLLSCAGGNLIQASYTLNRLNIAYPVYTLVISGLNGGHSGMDINLYKGNANKIGARILKELQLNNQAIYLVDFAGGNKDNAIPRDCTVRFATAAPLNQLEEAIKTSAAQIKRELSVREPNLEVTLISEESSYGALSEQNTADILNFIYLCPHGVQSMSQSIAGLVESSQNVASVHADERTLIVNVSVRANMESLIDDLSSKIRLLAAVFNFTTTTTNRYPGWLSPKASHLRDAYAKVLKEKYDMDLAIEAAHGGTECGVFNQLIPSLDIITLGPISGDVHTPQEWLDLKSFAKTYGILCDVIAELK